MKNQLFQQLNPLGNLLPNNISQIKQMMNMVNSASNPQSMIQNMMGSNPQMKQVMDLVQKSGGDPKKAFYTMAEQQGVDPNQILNLLK